MSTRTRFEEEAKGNSEMVYCKVSKVEFASNPQPVTRHKSPATRHPLLATRHPLLVTRHPESATRHPWKSAAVLIIQLFL